MRGERVSPSELWKFKESVYRQTIVDRDNEIYRLKREIDKLKNNQQTYNWKIVNCSETTAELAFPRFRKYAGDMD